MANETNPRNGEINVNIEEEKIIWKDRKRTLFGLPWSFTVYKLTPSRVILQTGLFNKRVDEVRLYRVKDISYHQTFGERIFGLGCVKLYSSDASLPELTLKRIKNSEKVKEVISQSVELARRESGVRTSELVGNVMGSVAGSPDGFPGGEHGPSAGPEMFPDFNHDGIDDRQQ